MTLTNMNFKVVHLSPEHLSKFGVATDSEQAMAYFSDGSLAYCLLGNGEPVIAGGVVSMHWKRGEAWLLTTNLFYKHVRVCYKFIRDIIPYMSVEGNFKRIQATCDINKCASYRMFEHLKFQHEGTLESFGSEGETCFVYARIFR